MYSPAQRGKTPPGTDHRSDFGSLLPSRGTSSSSCRPFPETVWKKRVSPQGSLEAALSPHPPPKVSHQNGGGVIAQSPSPPGLCLVTAKTQQQRGIAAHRQSNSCPSRNYTVPGWDTGLFICSFPRKATQGWCCHPQGNPVPHSHPTYRLPGHVGHQATSEQYPRAPHYSRGAGEAAAASGKTQPPSDPRLLRHHQSPQHQQQGPRALRSAPSLPQPPLAPPLLTCWLPAGRNPTGPGAELVGLPPARGGFYFP